MKMGKNTWSYGGLDIIASIYTPLADKISTPNERALVAGLIPALDKGRILIGKKDGMAARKITPLALLPVKSKVVSRKRSCKPSGALYYWAASITVHPSIKWTSNSIPFPRTGRHTLLRIVDLVDLVQI